MKNTNLRRLLALLLMLVMCFSLLPAAAFAEDGVDGDDPGYTEPENRDPEQEETEPHVHEYVPTVTEPSCEAGGYTTWVCACGDYYLDTFTDPVDHTPQSVEAAAPTCTEAGHAAGTVCAVCGEILEGCEAIPATGHTPEDVEAVPAADEEAGHEAGVVCAVCGEILEGCEEIPPLDPSRQGSNLLSTKSEVASGPCGSFMSWSLDSDGVLTISGSGQMNNFSDSPWGSYADQITRAVIENGVINIGNAAFLSNYNLKSIAIPDSVKQIGDWAFEWCDALESITFSSNVTYIGFQSFAGCTKLETVSMPSTTRGMTIRDQAFAGCTKLKNINIPNGVTEIDTQTFRGCAMESIVIPSSVSVIGQHAFQACNNLKSITFNHSSNAQLTINSSAFLLDSTWPLVPTNIYVPNAKSMNPAIQNYSWTGDYRSPTYISADIGEASPIIVIPGIMGSKLNTMSGENVWPSTTGGLINLSLDNAMVVPGDPYGLFLEGNEPYNDWDYEYGSLNTYKALVDYLMEAFPDRDIYFFSYDWRQRNETSAACLYQALNNRHITKANFICHSMGGLVLSQFVYLGFSDFIDRALILGTPYEGATRMIEAMLTYRAIAGPLGLIANPIAWAEGLSPALKRTLPGLGELMPTQEFNGHTANTITVRKQTPSMNSANMWNVYGYVPDWVVNLSTLKQWLALPTLLASKEEKESVSQYLSDQEAWMGKNRLADIKVYRYDDYVQLRAVFEEDIPYEYVLMNAVQNPNEVEEAQANAKAGYLKLLNMSNVFFGIGETRDTMTGLTIVWDETYEHAKLVDVFEAAGDGTVPLFSANMAGRITGRVRYFNPDHNGLVKEVDSDAQIQNWINYVFLKNKSDSNTGRTGPSPSAKTSSRKVIIHCPVYAYVSCKGETLTNDPDAFCDETSFGRMYTLGEGADESKLFILDGDVDCDIVMRGTDEGSMEFEIRNCDGEDNVIEARLAEDIPLTASTVITTDTDMADNTILSVDADNDGSVDEEIVVAPVGGLTEPLRFDQSYIAMKKGDRFSLNLTVNPGQLSRNVAWAAVDADNVLLGENPVITIDEEKHEIVACCTGTAYAVAYVACGDQVYYARCRVDVVPAEGEGENVHFAEEQLTGVRLLDTKATVELYKLDYTRITVIPELSQNSAMAGVDLREDLPAEAGNTGWAITNAEFVEDSKNADINKYFTLRVVDDRTLEIIPTDEAREAGAANDKALKSSCKAAITVTVDGEPFTTAPLSLTVKKTVPKVTAKALKFNSFRTEETLPLDFNGMAVDRVEASGETPAWLTLDAEAQSVTFNQAEYGGTRQSDRLNLTVCPTGWAVMLPVTVSASAASTKPKLTLKPASVNLQPVGGDNAVTAAAITPAEFAGQKIEKVSILEGKLPAEDVLAVEISGNEIFVRAGSGLPDDGKAHTYKVTLGVKYGENLVSTSALTVKLLAKKAPALTAKAKGTIDLAVPKSPVTITPTLKNVGGNASCALTAILNADGEDVKDTLFRVEGFTITGEEALKELVPAGKQARFTAVVTASIPGGKPVEAKTAFTVKQSAKAPAASVTLKAKGGIDVIRPASAVTITPTVKNLYGWELAEGIVTITRTYDSAERKTVSEDVTARFDVTPENGAYVIAKRAGAEVSHLDKFTVTVTLEGVPSRTLALPVKMGSAKVTQSAKTVNLIKTDKFSRGVVKLAAADETLAPIDWEKTQREFTSPLFDLQVLGAGEVSIGFKDNQIGKAGTVKIPVFLEGNESTKPNATISVSVKLA